MKCKDCKHCEAFGKSLFCDLTGKPIDEDYELTYGEEFECANFEEAECENGLREKQD